MNMYEVEAKCGHVGRNNYILRVFVIEAESGKEAAARVREFPRVKHHHKDAIRRVSVIDEMRYAEILDANKKDPYLRCKNIQDQLTWCQDLSVFRENEKEEHAESEQSSKKVYYHKLRVRNPRKFYRMHMGEEVIA